MAIVGVADPNNATATDVWKNDVYDSGGGKCTTRPEPWGKHKVVQYISVLAVF